jgi:hypothetical protein
MLESIKLNIFVNLDSNKIKVILFMLIKDKIFLSSKYNL